MNTTFRVERNIRGNRNGTFFAVVMRHQDGQQRWHTTPAKPTLEEARADRDALERDMPRKPPGGIRPGTKLGPRRGHVWVTARGRLGVGVQAPENTVVIASGLTSRLRHHVEKMADRIDGHLVVPGMHAATTNEQRAATAKAFARALQSRLAAAAAA